jgi:conjugal transfer/entry exclusion protein
MRKIVLTTVALVLVAALPATSPGTGIPVIDFSNLTQNVVTALHQVSAYAQEVQLRRQGTAIAALIFWR